VWEILKTNGIQPAPQRDNLTWTTLPAQPGAPHAGREPGLDRAANRVETGPEELAGNGSGKFPTGMSRTG
jgi:hypothetical protein